MPLRGGIENMQVAIDAPTRPALRYYGGKWNLAEWIISFFPPHLNYVEPCGGGASVLSQKPPSKLETYNDADGNVVNFFRVLRDRPDELIRKIRLTPWARAEYDLSRSHTRHEDCTEWARRYFLSLWASMHGGTGSSTSSTFRVTKNWLDRSTIAPMDIDPNNLWKVAERFRLVQIENDDALTVIARYDNEYALHYFDPPYVFDTRSCKGDTYGIEVNDGFHIAAADLLRTAVGYVIISGYACPLYTDLYERHGWQRHDKIAQTNSGGKRIESVWLSPRTAEAIERPRQRGLFA